MKITIDSIKKTVLLTGGLFLSALSVNADNRPSGLTPEMLLPQFNKMSPEAASLGRYGAFQVSEYSGAANISIPLYTVKSGDVSFPINLYYDATGIKVEQDATMVGLGWNLSYGGMISHIVCGEDDFREYKGNPEFEQNWWKEEIKAIKKNIPNDAPWFLENYIQKWTGETFPYGLPDPNCKDSLGTKFWTKHALWDGSPRDLDLKMYINMTKGYGVPDVFHASFCGHNISFVIDKRTGGTEGSYPIIIINNNPRKYKISYKTDGKAPSGSHGYPTSFKIIDDKGITYCFTGYSEIPYDKSIDSYYLTKIYGPDGEKGKSKVEIKYIQKRILFGEYGGSRHPSKNHVPSVKRIINKGDYITSEESVNHAYNNLISPGWYSRAIGVGCNDNPFCEKVYPQSIVTAFDSIVFQKGERTDLKGAMEIDRIIIHSKIGSAKKYIDFKYSYFTETPAKEYQRNTYTHKRLQLTSVKIDDQKYMFEYSDSVLPSFNSYSKDYWGYYNGANPNAIEFVGCSPAYAISNGKVVPVEDYLEGSNRLASEKLCKVGMLKKVTYPTGGYTLYEFEANRFNDKYYYPDASEITNILKKVDDFTCNINGYMGEKNGSMSFKVSKETKYILDASVSSISGKKDVSTIILKTNAGKIIKELSSSNGNNKDGIFDITLSKGDYIIEARLSIDNNDGAPAYVHAGTTARCTLSHNSANTITKNENGGYSIGGGVRVKTIKNYDSDSTYLNGVKYEYFGGKLLSPTVHLETHYVNFQTDDRGPYNTNFSFHYANTEPSYLYICSLDIPATVGYDRVVKNEINEKGNVTYRKTVLDFHNYGYDTSTPAEQINTLMQNAFYYLPYNQGHLNGMIKTDSVFVGSVKASTTEYDYGSMPIDTIYYQKCLPLHLDVEVAVKNYNTTFFRKCNTWTYLTSKRETLYDSKGNKTTSNTTSFQYNPTNYQLSDQSVTNGTNTSRTHYSYPASNTLRFMKNVLSEVDGVETYRNETFTGGSKYIFKVHKNPQTGASFSVVETCYSLLPNASKSKVTEMTVTSYDDYGNIREYKKKDETPVTVIWSYNHQLPIMEIVGSTYTEVCDKAKNVKDISSLENASSVSETTMSSIHATLRENLPNTLVTAYTYSPWHSVSQIIKPNGEKVVYSYDKYGRLETVLDANQSTFLPIQKFTYNYKKEK